MAARERPASRVWAPLQICRTGSHCVTRPMKCFTLCRDQKHFENCLLSPLPFSWPASAVGEPFFADSWKSISPRISASWRQSRPPGLADGATPTPVFHSTSPCLIHVPALAPRQPGRGHNSAEAAFPSTSASGVLSGGLWGGRVAEATPQSSSEARPLSSSRSMRPGLQPRSSRSWSSAVCTWPRRHSAVPGGRCGGLSATSPFLSDRDPRMPQTTFNVGARVALYSFENGGVERPGAAWPRSPAFPNAVGMRFSPQLGRNSGRG